MGGRNSVSSSCRFFVRGSALLIAGPSADLPLLLSGYVPLLNDVSSRERGWRGPRQPFEGFSYQTSRMGTLAVGLATPSTTPVTAAPDADRVDAALAADGDQCAFERLYRRHAARVYNLARRMLGSEDVDDAVQDIFVRTWNKLGLFRGEAAFGTWLHRLAVNVLLARRETRGIHERRHHDGEGPLDSAPSRPVRPDLGMDFERAMLRLPDGAREVFVLYDVEGYRHEEIAGMLEISVGTSKSQLHHARMALRRYLGR